MAQPKKGDTVSIIYDRPEGRPTFAVGGAFGGPSPDGSAVFAHVYTEYLTLPSIEEHEVGEGGVVQLDKGHRIKRGDITREVQATLVMAPEVAVRLGRFLVEHAEKAIKARSGG